MDARKRVATDLGLPGGDAFTQNWAFELSQQYRTLEWLQKYVEAYGNADYSDAERKLLVDLALDVTNDLMQTDVRAGEQAWAAVAKIISAAPELHRDQLAYWACYDQPLEDAFALAARARELRLSVYNAEDLPTNRDRHWV